MKINRRAVDDFRYVKQGSSSCTISRGEGCLLCNSQARRDILRRWLMLQRRPCVELIRVEPPATSLSGLTVRGRNIPSVSRQNFFNDAAVNISQAEVATLKAISQAFVIEAQQVQNRGLQIVNVGLAFGDSKTQFVRRAQ